MRRVIWAKAQRASRLKEGDRDSCVTRVLGGLATQESAVTMNPHFSRAEERSSPSTHCGHGVSDEGFVGIWVSLHVGGHDLGVFAKITFECLALPSAFRLDDV